MPLITSSVEDAMTLAQGALDKLNTRPWSLPADQDISNLANFIFKEDGTAPPMTKPFNPPDTRGNLDKVRGKHRFHEIQW